MRKSVMQIRLVVPGLLSGLGFVLATGCLYIPTFNRTIEGRDVSRQVGPGTSDRPLRVGGATRDEVFRLLGPPDFATPDATRVAYTWKVLHGVVGRMGSGNCGSRSESTRNDGGRHEGARALFLEFDGAGVLRSFNPANYDGEPGDPVDVTYVIPMGMRPWHARADPQADTRPAETGPATRP